MLRRTAPRRFYRGHTAPTVPKHVDKPGIWGPNAGPMKDTLARRVYFYRIALLVQIGKLTKPLRTPNMVWMWRRTQTRVWKVTVFTLFGISVIMLGNIWVMFSFYATSVGPSSPALERKVREHRLSKQIMQMVREREREIAVDKEVSAVAAVERK